MDHDADIDFCDSSVEPPTESTQQLDGLITGSDDQSLANADGEDAVDGSAATAGSRNVKAKISHPSSPRSREQTMDLTTDELKTEPKVEPKVEPEESGPNKVRVVVKDVAYTTYRAVLYYVSYLIVHAMTLHTQSFHTSYTLTRYCLHRSPLPSIRPSIPRRQPHYPPHPRPVLKYR